MLLYNEKQLLVLSSGVSKRKDMCCLPSIGALQAISASYSANKRWGCQVACQEIIFSQVQYVCVVGKRAFEPESHYG